LDPDEGSAAQVTRNVGKNEPLLWDDVELPDGHVLDAYRRQEQLLGG
jgi:hypothetical protein